jgi:hypothetical protein
MITIYITVIIIVDVFVAFGLGLFVEIKHVRFERKVENVIIVVVVATRPLQLLPLLLSMRVVSLLPLFALLFSQQLPKCGARNNNTDAN